MQNSEQGTVPCPILPSPPQNDVVTIGKRPIPCLGKNFTGEFVYLDFICIFACNFKC